VIALIDYKAGNLTSVRKALAAVQAEVYTPEVPTDLDRASAIIVPGVGHFAATAALDAGWHETILRRVEAGTPLLGICLGMQFLFDGSTEAPDVPGLGLLRGRCELLAPPSSTDGFLCKVPHVGWNALAQRGSSSRLLADVPDHAQAYFTHSYVVPDTDATVAWTTHGLAFPSVVERGHVFGAQFHPEKSGETGLAMLRDFLKAVG
jgi:imidazole glycerol-phosphate synthase subunit HisH